MRLPATESALRRALRGPCALPRGATVLVAVSGGADSTALAVALARLAPEFGLRLAIAHLHHGTRGATADADAAHVRALAARLRLPCVSGRLRTGTTSETALRMRRRRFLAAAARRIGAVAVFTAHTADDQLETLLLRLGRGTSMTGLAGMRSRSGCWLKPLLALPRAAIETDLRAAGIDWLEDASNRDRTHARNRVRHDALPALVAAIAPGHSTVPARARLAQRVSALLAELAESDQHIDALADRALESALAPDGALELADWRRQPAALQRRMLRRWWHRATGRARPGLLARHLDMLLRIASQGRGGARAALPAAWWAQVESGRLRLNRGGGPRSGASSQRRNATIAAGSPEPADRC